jgi:hypothetical protein
MLLVVAVAEVEQEQPLFQFCHQEEALVLHQPSMELLPLMRAVAVVVVVLQVELVELVVVVLEREILGHLLMELPILEEEEVVLEVHKIQA